MSNESTPVANNRRELRVTYPSAAAPRIRLSPTTELVVSDISENGVGIALTPQTPSIGSSVDAVLHFPGRPHNDRLIHGTVVHTKLGRWAITLTAPLAAGLIVSEQGYLIGLQSGQSDWPSLPERRRGDFTPQSTSVVPR